MDTPENQAPKKFPWITTIVIVIVVLAGLQWWMTRSHDDASSQNDAYSTSTPAISLGDTSSTGSTDQPASTTTQPVTNTNNNPPTKNFMHTITIETTKGTIVFETYDADAPKTAENFVTLANKGFYDGTIFHRVISGFMIQGGDPTGTGMGGPGYKFADELNPATPSFKAGYVRGTVAMANSGPNTNGSQFFIMHKDTPLPNNYTIFGRVVSGLDVVDAIAATPVGPNDRPVTDMVMKKVTVKAK